MFEALVRMQPWLDTEGDNLVTVDLSGNPLVCDCYLVTIHTGASSGQHLTLTGLNNTSCEDTECQLGDGDPVLHIIVIVLACALTPLAVCCATKLCRKQFLHREDAAEMRKE